MRREPLSGIDILLIDKLPQSGGQFTHTHTQPTGVVARSASEKASPSKQPTDEATSSASAQGASAAQEEKGAVDGGLDDDDDEDHPIFDSQGPGTYFPTLLLSTVGKG